VDLFRAVWVFLADLGTDIFANVGLRLFPIYLLSTAIIAYLIYRRVPEPKKQGFWKFLVPAEFYKSNSTLVDVKLFLVGRILTGFGLFRVGLTLAVVVFVLTLLSTITGQDRSSASPSNADIALATIVVLVASDFCVYWIHRIHHEHPALWPFHAVHHSAETMTPITVYRKHPVYDLIGTVFRGLLLGTVQGVLLFWTTDTISIWAIGGANGFYILFNMLGSNLRHSHIWMGFGPVLSYIFISPAQHQIHHSRAVAHHNKNYGEILAIWDLMFGTLYVPQCEEKLEFGLADRDGKPIAQPHNTLREAMVQPFRASARAIRKKLSAQR